MSRRTNKLITVELEEIRGERPAAVFLMGMMSILTSSRAASGCVLIVTADPLLVPYPLPRKKGKRARDKCQEKVPNRVRVEGLFLSDFQKEILARFRSSADEEYVYLYTGAFSLQPDIRIPQQTGQSKMDLLLLLADHLSKRVLEFHEQCVPFEMSYIQDVIRARKVSRWMRKGRKGKETGVERGGQGQDMESKVRKEVFRLRHSGEQIFVDLEGPSKHQGYIIHPSLLQTMKCRMRARTSIVRREITRIVEKQNVCLRPGFRGGSLPRVWTIAGFKMPSKEEENAAAGGDRRQLCDGIQVVDVNYQVQAFFVTRRKEKSREVPIPKNEVKGGHGAELRMNLNVSEDSDSSSSSSSSTSSDEYLVDDHSNGYLTKLVIMGVQVDALEETDEDVVGN